ncbi:Holliday junction resolvase RecU [Anaerococcus obesiensis]|uniref:Holliday junction resolvase RecU n=1 Tax=Anaerococcus obesiensis TaxID=1287640 RepID=UPI00031A37D3|nr:Holliday junction resolvase RecU [Anaerococcus obesiensis]
MTNLQSFKSLQSNGFGKNFEKLIDLACKYYRDEGKADISKIDEPFRVIRLKKAGRFEGQFTKNANPDFEGTLDGGRSICFEAKYTTTDRMKQNVVSSKQAEVLEIKSKLGGLAGVCIGIKDRYFFIPWNIWTNMKEIFGRKYVKADDLSRYEVIFRQGVRFLDYKYE